LRATPVRLPGLAAGLVTVMVILAVAAVGDARRAKLLVTVGGA